MKTDHIEQNRRITSIDALRGVVLLGIFLVHAAGGFGFSEYTHENSGGGSR